MTLRTTHMKTTAAIAITWATVLLASCTVPEEHSGPLIVAHRGASHLAPENTMAAFNLAWQLDADLIEGDFYLSSDGAIIAHHDKTTKKTAGLDLPVSQQTLAELQALDVGAWKDARWVGERIPLLRDVLATVPPHGTILIEIKTDASIVPALAEVIEQCELQPHQMIVICFDEEVIARTKQMLPWIKAFWLESFDDSDSGHWEPTIDQVIETATRIRADGVDLNANLEVLNEESVAMIRQAGLELHVWTVNDAHDARRLMELGVDSITTDRPGWLREQLQSVPIALFTPE